MRKPCRECGIPRQVSARSLREPLCHDCRRRRNAQKPRRAPKRLIDLTGQRFDRLAVLHRVPSVYGNGSACWLCLCDCGAERVCLGSNLRGGRNRSCGCYRDEVLRARNVADPPMLKVEPERRHRMMAEANYRSARVRLGNRIDRQRAQIAALEEELASCHVTI